MALLPSLALITAACQTGYAEGKKKQNNRDKQVHLCFAFIKRQTFWEMY